MTSFSSLPPRSSPFPTRTRPRCVPRYAPAPPRDLSGLGEASDSSNFMTEARVVGRRLRLRKTGSSRRASRLLGKSNYLGKPGLLRTALAHPSSWLLCPPPSWRFSCRLPNLGRGRRLCLSKLRTRRIAGHPPPSPAGPTSVRNSFTTNDTQPTTALRARTESTTDTALLAVTRAAHP